MKHNWINFMPKDKRIWFSLLIAALCWLTYSNTFHNGFLIDDYLLFEDSKKLLQDTTALELFRQGHNYTYRPIGLLFLKWEYLWFHRNPVGYHLVNLTIFSGICVLIFLVFYQLTQNKIVSFLTASLYAVHPINNFLLNYKTASNLSLFILFSFISTWFFVRFVQKEKIAWLAASLFFYFIGLLCHEISFILPVYLFLMVYFFERKRLWRLACYSLNYLIPFLIFLLLRIGSKPSTKITGFLDIKLPFIQAWNTFITLVQWYISKLIYPLDILFMWEERLAAPAINIMNLAILCGWILTLIYIFWKKRDEAWGFALGIFSLGFLPAFLASFTYSPMLKTGLIEPHWFGYTSAGFFLLIAFGLWRLQKNFSPKIFAGFTLSLVVLLAGWTHYTNRLWKDDKTYCSYWIMINSMNATPWEALARRYILENKDKPARHSVDSANLGLMWHISRNAQKAYQYYDAALKMDEQCAAAYYGLGVLFSDLEQYELANRAFARAKQIQPEYYEAYRLLARIFIDQGEKDYGRRIKEIIDKANRVGTKEEAGHKLTGGGGIEILFQ